MAKKNNTLLIVGVLGVGAYLFYRYSQGQSLIPGTAVPSVLPTAPLVPTTGTVSVNTVSATGQNQSEVAEIMKWVNTLPQPQLAAATSAVPMMSPAEIDGLYDIVFNDFYGNGITTPAQALFWNSWRAKYNYP